MKHGKVTLLVGLVLILSLFLTAPVIPEAVPENRNEETQIGTFEISYDEHAVINIDNDTDFATQAANEGWDGDGAVDDPYVIDNYNITADGNCIDIRDVTVSFIIQSCFINS
ncbi:MAG: hypothetical protein ACTSQZ_03455, partial [Candidatus Thorarchaeota archaeon]